MPTGTVAETASAAYKGNGKVLLVDMEPIVRRSEDLALVDVVDFEGLQDLGFDEMTDATLGHHRDGHRLHDGLDNSGVGHTRP